MVRRLRLLMIVREDMAQIVMMMAGMLSDVFKFIQLLLIVLFGFAGDVDHFLGDNTGAGAAAERRRAGRGGRVPASIDLDGVCQTSSAPTPPTGRC